MLMLMDRSTCANACGQVREGMALGMCGEITLLEVLCDFLLFFFNPYSVLIFMLLSVV